METQCRSCSDHTREPVGQHFQQLVRCSDSGRGGTTTRKHGLVRVLSSVAVRSQYGWSTCKSSPRFRFWLDSNSLMDRGFNPTILTHASTHQQQLNAGPRVPTSNHLLNTFEASVLFDPTGYMDPASIDRKSVV